jgi:hypothetical protein
MKRELMKSKFSYLSLIIFLVLASFMFLVVWPDVHYQRYLILLISVFYFFWGLIFHLKTDQFSKKIILEYLAISILAGSMLFLITI